MTQAVLNYPSKVKLSTDADFRVVMLPEGIRTPATYTITAVAPTGSAVNVTVTAAAMRNATALTVAALSGAIPANALLQIGAQTVVTTAAAAANATTLAVRPLNFDISANSVLAYSPGVLTINSTMIPVAALPTLIDVGTVLTFGANKVVVTGRSPQGCQQLRVQPLAAALTANDTATTKALLCVVGLTSLTVPSPEPKIVETTNMKSGIGQESQATAVKFTFPVNYNRIDGDLGGDVLTRLMRNTAFYNREFYFETLMPDGELHLGVAILTAAPETAEIQDKRMVQGQATVQGTTYQTIEVASSFF